MPGEVSPLQPGGQAYMVKAACSASWCGGSVTGVRRMSWIWISMKNRTGADIFFLLMIAVNSFPDSSVLLPFTLTAASAYGYGCVDEQIRLRQSAQPYLLS